MSLLDRRMVLAGALTVLSLPVAARAATGPNLRLNILRNGKPFGQYTVVSTVSGDTTMVTSDVTMQARISGLTVFDYMLHCEEVWKAGRFMEMRSRSRRDSQAQSVTATRTPAGISVTNKQGLVTLPSIACPLTHWNPDTLQGPLFNPQDGFPLKITAQNMGRTPVTLASGAKLNATHWALSGESQIDDWYDDAGVWTGLRAVFPDKSIVEYRRV